MASILDILSTSGMVNRSPYGGYTINPAMNLAGGGGQTTLAGAGGKLKGIPLYKGPEDFQRRFRLATEAELEALIASGVPELVAPAQAEKDRRSGRMELIPPAVEGEIPLAEIGPYNPDTDTSTAIPAGIAAAASRPGTIDVTPGPGIAGAARATQDQEFNRIIDRALETGPANPPSGLEFDNSFRHAVRDATSLRAQQGIIPPEPESSTPPMARPEGRNQEDLGFWDPVNRRVIRRSDLSRDQFVDSIVGDLLQDPDTGGGIAAGLPAREVGYAPGAGTNVLAPPRSIPEFEDGRYQDDLHLQNLERQKKAAAEEEKIVKKADRALKKDKAPDALRLALIRAGLAMAASERPDFLGALAEGGLKGLDQYIGTKAAERKAAQEARELAIKEREVGVKESLAESTKSLNTARAKKAYADAVKATQEVKLAALLGTEPTNDIKNYLFLRTTGHSHEDAKDTAFGARPIDPKTKLMLQTLSAGIEASLIAGGTAQELLSGDLAAILKKSIEDLESQGLIKPGEVSGRPVKRFVRKDGKLVRE